MKQLYLQNIITNLNIVVDDFDKIKKSMFQLVDSQKKYFEKGHIYLDLKYCNKKDCFFCPHNFVWVVSYRDKSNTLKKIELGKVITHKILKKYDKDFLYPKLKELESKAKTIQAERDIVARGIDKINKILNRYIQYKNNKPNTLL